MSTGEIQQMDQCFKRPFYYIRLYVHKHLKVPLLRSPWELKIHLEMLPQSHLAIVETTTIKLWHQSKRKKL